MHLAGACALCLGIFNPQGILFHGEQYKSLAVLDTVFTALLQKPHGRDTTLVALGGGVVGDLTAGEGQVLEFAGGDLAALEGLRQHATVVGHDDRQFWLLNVILIPLSFLLNVSRVERALLIAVALWLVLKPGAMAASR